MQVNQGTDLNNNDMANKMAQDRRRLQNYQGLYQSWEGLVKMKDEISSTSIPNQQEG